MKKICRICNKELPLEKYVKRVGKTGNVNYDLDCNSCRSIINRAKREKVRLRSLGVGFTSDLAPKPSIKLPTLSPEEERKMIDSWLKNNKPSITIKDEPMPHLSQTMGCCNG